MATIPNLTKNVPLSREDFAYESIKEAIISGELKPNQKISLTDLSKSLGVSIIPVNNAVRRLTTEGLIRQDPHRSPYVAEFSADALKEVLKIRYHMEELALREAIPCIGETEMAELRAVKVKLDQAVNEQDMNRYGVMNREFHMQIYSYNPYSMLSDLIDDLWNKAELNRSRSVFSIVQNMAEHSQEDHEKLLDAIEQKDTEKAIELLRLHREYSKNKLLEKIK